MKYTIVFFIFLTLINSRLQFCMQIMGTPYELPLPLESKIKNYTLSPQFKGEPKKYKYEPFEESQETLLIPQTLNTLEPIIVQTQSKLQKNGNECRAQPGNKCTFRTQFWMDGGYSKDRIRLDDDIQFLINYFYPENFPKYYAKRSHFCDGTNKNGFAIVATNDNSKENLYLNILNINNPYNSLRSYRRRSLSDKKITASLLIIDTKAKAISFHNNINRFILATKDRSKKKLIRIFDLQPIPRGFKQKILSLPNFESDFKLQTIITCKIEQNLKKIHVLTNNLYLALDTKGSVYSIFNTGNTIEMNKKTIKHKDVEDFFDDLLVDPLHPKNIMLVNKKKKLFYLTFNETGKIILVKITGHFLIQPNDQLWLYDYKLGSLSKKNTVTIQDITPIYCESDTKKTLFQKIRYQLYLYSYVAYEKSVLFAKIAFFIASSYLICTKAKKIFTSNAIGNSF